MQIWKLASLNGKTLTAVAITFGVFSVGYPSEALAVCKPTLSMSGPLPNNTKAGAQLLARSTWQANASHNYGGPYAKWSKAQNKQSKCVVSSSKHTCTYSANPCN